MDEFKDRRIKYVELPTTFSAKATEIAITAKQQLRACERLAAHLAKQRPNNPKDFEQNEWLKDFVLKTSKLNEQTISLLDFLKMMVQDISTDAKELMAGGQELDRQRDQEEAIKALQAFRDNHVIQVYERRKTQLCRAH